LYGVYGFCWNSYALFLFFQFHIRRIWFVYHVGTNSFSWCNGDRKTAINQLIDNDEIYMRCASNLMWWLCSKSYLMRKKAYIAFFVEFLSYTVAYTGTSEWRRKKVGTDSESLRKIIDKIRIPFLSTSLQGLQIFGWLLRFLVFSHCWRFHMRPHMKLRKAHMKSGKAHLKS
jgi:hypothetical protein